MSIKQTIASAGRNRHTIILTAREKDGSIETREAEPYSYRFEKGSQYFYCYDVRKQGIRKFLVSNSETLPCERLTVLVGANGTGKSSFLRALDLFYTANARYTAHFKQNLEATLRMELGETLFDTILGKCRCDMGFAKKKHAIKCPAVIQRIIEEARKQGKTSTTLEEIVERIVALRSN